MLTYKREVSVAQSSIYSPESSEGQGKDCYWLIAASESSVELEITVQFQLRKKYKLPRRSHGDKVLSFHSQSHRSTVQHLLTSSEHFYDSCNKSQLQFWCYRFFYKCFSSSFLICIYRNSKRFVCPRIPSLMGCFQLIHLLERNEPPSTIHAQVHSDTCKGPGSLGWHRRGLSAIQTSDP